jgi:hypothetical protein
MLASGNPPNDWDALVKSTNEKISSRIAGRFEDIGLAGPTGSEEN